MATTMTSCQALWLRNLLSEWTKSELKLVTLYVDSKSTIALMMNLVFHRHNKHIALASTSSVSVSKRDKSLWSSYAPNVHLLSPRP